MKRLNGEWTLQPAGGNTGQAFMGTNAQDKIFLKRNSSPFLAAVAMTGLTPRLIWTKRVPNGDVYAAQEWLNGRALSAQEMQEAIVRDVIRYYQHSAYLRNMLTKVAGTVWHGADFLRALEREAAPAFLNLTFVQTVITRLRDSATDLPHTLTVCHGDLNRQNFFLTTDGRLYLVDWEAVKLAHPFYDLAQLLVHYVPLERWRAWLVAFGTPLDDPGQWQTLEWYALLHALTLAERAFREGNYPTFNHTIDLMHALYQKGQQWEEGVDAGTTQTVGGRFY